MQHLAVRYEGLIEEACGVETVIRNYVLDYTQEIRNIMAKPDTNISAIVYEGAHKSVTNRFKFDSDPERLFALACESSPEVVQWLRPAPKQFNITYNRGKRYEPDFVVETADMYYLVEIKDMRKLDDPDVLAKEERAIRYCQLASEYNLANGHKAFGYLLIPHNEVSSNSSFENLAKRFLRK